MIKLNNFMKSDKKNRIYTPYLSIYRPQFGNIISIIERISGIFLVFSLGIVIIISELKRKLLLSYYFYTFYFLLIKGSVDNNIINSLIVFLILNFLYHIIFIPLILKRYNSLFGNINNYNITNFKEIILKSSISVGILVIFGILTYIIVK